MQDPNTESGSVLNDAQPTQAVKAVLLREAPGESVDPSSWLYKSATSQTRDMVPANWLGETYMP